MKNQSARKNNEFYRLIAENTSDLIALTTFDRQVKYIYINKAYAQILGYKPDDLIGQSAFEFIHKDDIKKLTPLLAKYLALKVKKFFKIEPRNSVERINFRIKDRTGAWHYVESTVNVMGEDKLIFISKDISERKKIEEKLRISKKNYQQIFDNLPFIAFTLDKRGRLLYANKKAEEFTGFKADDFRGKSFKDFGLLSKKEYLIAVKEFLKNMRGKVTEKTIYHIKRFDGKTRELELIGIPLFEDDKVVNVLDVGEDVTEKRLMESRIAKERMRASQYLDIAGTIILALDGEGKVILINRKGREILGARKKDVVGKNWIDNFVPPEQRKNVKEVFQKLKTGQKKEVEYYENEIITRSNERKLIGWHNTYLKNEEGEISVILSSGEDITERRKAKEKLIEFARKWEETLNFLSGGVSIHARDFTIVDANKSLCRILGKSKEEIIGRKCYEVFHNKNKPIAECPMLKSMQSKRKETVEIFEPAISKWLAVATVPIVGDNGEIKKTIHEVNDITERKQAEIEIKKRNEELEKANKLMVGRELKMIELKKQIKKLEEKLKD